MKDILTVACLITSLLVFSQSVADEIRWGREARGEAGDEEWGSRVRNLVNQLNAVPMEELSPEHLPEGYEERVIAELWRRKEYPKLVKMGDEEAMEAYAQSLIRTEARYVRASQTIASTYSPSFIKHLGPLLFHDEFFGQREVGPGRGRFDYGFTMTIANGITALIAQSPEFDDNVRQWAENGFFQRKYLPDPVSHIRDWWKENEIYFENEDYYLVRVPTSLDLGEAPAERGREDGMEDQGARSNEERSHSDQEDSGEVEEEHLGLTSDTPGSSDTRSGWLLLTAWPRGPDPTGRVWLPQSLSSGD